MNVVARPADAYFAVAAAINDPTYFTTPPPTEGVRLTVVGRDRVATQWDMSRDRARIVTPLLLIDHSLYVRPRAFDETGKS